MEDLEVALRKIEGLKGDLSAEIVIQEEEGHAEEMSTGWYGEGRVVKEWVIDKPRIAQPDTEKREAARAQLQEILDSPEWYAARCYTGWALGKSMYNLAKGWIAELESQLANSTPSVRLHAIEDIGEFPWRRGIPIAAMEDPEVSGLFQSHRDSVFPNAKNILRRCYNENNDRAMRVEAGRKLGYNRLRILAHEISRKVSHYLLAK